MKGPFLIDKNIRHLISISILNTDLLYQFNGEPFCCFYAISSLDSDGPFYISEVISSSNMKSCSSNLTFDNNLIFQDVNLNKMKNNNIEEYHSICNLKQFHLNVYMNLVNKESKWKLMKSIQVDLKSLVFVDNMHKFLSDPRSVLDGKNMSNIVFVDLTDGCYIVPEISINELYFDLLKFKSAKDEDEEQTDGSSVTVSERSSFLQVDLKPFNGSNIISFDRILKLNNLKLCIDDIDEINKALSDEIEYRVSVNGKGDRAKEFPEMIIQAKSVRHKLALMTKCITSQKNRTIKLKNELLLKKKHLNALKQRASENQDENEEEDHQIEDVNVGSKDDPDLWKIFMRSDSCERNNKLLDLYAEKQKKELARIFKDLLDMFEIVPMDSNPIEFQILGYNLSKLHCFISFPNYENCHEYDDVTLLYKNTHLQTEIDTALGYAAQLIDLVAEYLQVPLKYPILKLGSRSYIRDNISNMVMNQKRNDSVPMQYPLFVNSSHTVKFEFGIRLLLQDLQLLLTSVGLTVPDKWNLLGNLKMLMLYCASFD